MKKLLLIVFSMSLLSITCFAGTQEAQLINDQPQTGKLYIYSEVAEARIYVDDLYKTTDYVELENEPIGDHYVRVMAGDDKLFDQVVTVTPEAVTKIIIKENRELKKTLIATRSVRKDSSFPFRESIGVRIYSFSYFQSSNGVTISRQLSPGAGLDMNLTLPLANPYALEAGCVLGWSNSFDNYLRQVPISFFPLYINAILKSDWLHIGGGINYSMWATDTNTVELTPGFGYQFM